MKIFGKFKEQYEEDGDKYFLGIVVFKEKEDKDGSHQYYYYVEEQGDNGPFDTITELERNAKRWGFAFIDTAKFKRLKKKLLTLEKKRR